MRPSHRERGPISSIEYFKIINNRFKVMNNHSKAIKSNYIKIISDHFNVISDHFKIKNIYWVSPIEMVSQ